jgi:hypothetical protein
MNHRQFIDGGLSADGGMQGQRHHIAIYMELERLDNDADL